MASSVALTAACRCTAAAPYAVPAASATATGWLQYVKGSRNYVGRESDTTVKTDSAAARPMAHISKKTRCSVESAAAQAARGQQQKHFRSRSSHSKVFFFPLGRKLPNTATDTRQKTTQRILGVALLATSHSAMAPGRTGGRATPDISRFTVLSGCLPQHAAQGHSSQREATAAKGCQQEDVGIPTSAGTQIRRNDDPLLHTADFSCSSAAERMYVGGTEGWPVMQRSIEAEKHGGVTTGVRGFCGFCDAKVKTQSACKASFKMGDMELNRFTEPWSCVKRHIDTVVRQTSVRALRTRRLCCSSCFRRSIRAAFPSASSMQRHVSIFDVGVKATTARDLTRPVVTSDSTPRHILLTSPTAGLVGPGLALPGRTYAGAASAASIPAPVRAPCSLVRCSGAMGSRKATFSAPAAGAMSHTRSATRAVAGSGGVAARNTICVTGGGGVAPWASAATNAELCRHSLTRATSSVAASSRGAGVVMTLPLGSLYSKTHEYVRLLLELVGHRQDTGCGAAVPAAPGKRKEETAADCRSGRVRRCRLVGLVGLSAHAAEELGEVVYCEYSRRIAAAAALAGEFNDATALQQVMSTDIEDEKVCHEDSERVKQEELWVRRGSPLCSLESVKSVAEAYSPVEGLILEVNTATLQSPTLVWRDPEMEGWLVKLLLPLPAAHASHGSSDDELENKDSLFSTFYLTDADVGTAAWEQALAAPVGPVVEKVEAEAADNYKRLPTVEAFQEAEDAHAFIKACRNCQRLQDGLVGMRRRLMGPEQYVQFVEREKKSKEIES